MPAIDVSTAVLAAKNGDEAAFSHLVEHYQNAATSVALAILRNVGASQDVAQAAFVLAWRKLKTLRQPESFGPWLLQLARNEALQALRSDKRRAARERAWQDVQVPGDDDSMYENLYKSLDDVPDDCRELLLLYYREGRSTAQVAELLSLSAPAVRKRLERAREVLRERFDAVENAAKKSAPAAAFVVAVMASVRTASAAPAAAGAGFFVGAGALAVVLIGALVWWPAKVQEKAQPQVAVTKKKHAPWSPAGAGVTAGPAPQTWQTRDDDTLALLDRGSAHVEGRVTDAKGAPMSNATVLYALYEGTRRFTTNAAGEYAGEVPPGEYTVSARQGDRAATRARLIIEDDTCDIDLVLGESARIDGLVLAPDRKPLKTRLALSVHARNGDWSHTESSEDGTFSFEGLPPGLYDVVAYTDDRTETPAVTGISVQPGGSFFAELSFRAASLVTARLLDDTGAPLAGLGVSVGDYAPARVETESAANGTVTLPRALPLGKNRFVVYERGETTDIDRRRDAPSSRMLWSDRVNNEGQPIDIVIPRMGELRIDDAAGAYRYVSLERIESNGGWTPELARVLPLEHTATVRVPSGKWHVVPSQSPMDDSAPTPIVVTLEPGKTARVKLPPVAEPRHILRIVEENGAPARGAVVASAHQQWQADDRGVIDDIVPDAYPFTARASIRGRGAEFTFNDALVHELTVTLTPPGAVRGTIEGVLGNEIVSVSVMGPNQRWFVMLAPLRFVGPSFVLDDVPAGEVTLTVQTDMGRAAKIEVTVASGEERIVHVPLGQGAQVIGSSEVQNGPTPLPLPVITLDDHASTYVGGGESFVFKHIPAGTHTIRGSMFGKTFAERTVTITDGETVTLDPFTLDVSQVH